MIETDIRTVYNVEDIKVLLGIGRNQAYELCRSGRFVVKHIGNRIVVSKDSFNKWLLTSDEKVS